MLKEATGRAALAAAVTLGLAGCTLPPTEQSSMAVTDTTFGSLKPHITPVGAPLRCIGDGKVFMMYAKPDDPRAARFAAGSPVATFGDRVGKWLLVTTRANVTGWIIDPHPESYSQEFPGRPCHVFVNSRGRVVFQGAFAIGTF